ncbi:Gfo/Idh/MocA family protein [Vagococcus elongatus]|uniref:Oxidoreductase n=1 Tax=Vagococcus elongatus TaxID=180344 RepID=A0A430B4D6_9ENTE|nr:Gfo/Idh/MocA family oxidoreductase [Vagococcus elongatus]RSU15101.1 oxidoreductase [Vagococcus elongatus]
MLNLGIIGTNWITHQFVEAAIAIKEFELHSVYSRKENTALEFGKPYEVTNIFTDLEQFLADPALEVVYIASPNSLHYEQAKAAILNKKHVIVEKPAVSMYGELEELVTLAAEHGVFYFEAARNIHEANFKKVAELLPPKEELVAANFTFMKYSSRYDAVLAGEDPNIFSPRFSGGALMDLGIYLVYAAVAWFGVPENVHYFARKISTGVDGTGQIIFRYANFDVVMMTGKTSTSFMPAEIISYQETILLDAVNSISEVKIYHRQTDETEIIPVTKEENPMVEEAAVFADMINHPQENEKEYEQLLELTKDVHKIMEELRLQENITFPADKNN